MNVRETFLKLTTKTYPYRTEDQLAPILPKNLTRDKYGNRYIRIGESQSMFTAHMDTVGWGGQSNVKHVFTNEEGARGGWFSRDKKESDKAEPGVTWENARFVKTDGSTILGADDKAGVTILMYMIEHKVPGLYYFFVGEESGCQGSRPVASVFDADAENIKRCISFDRRGYGSVITRQSGGNCCSPEFTKAMCDLLNAHDWIVPWKGDPGGIFTDSAKFMPKISECTNLSVGYFSEHSSGERQNLEYLEKLCEVATKVDWESLPSKRVPVGTSYYGGWGSTYSTGSGTQSGGSYTKPTYGKRRSTRNDSQDQWSWWDDEYYGRY